jgi:hypothetical protein
MQFRGRGRHKPGVMNKLERSYSDLLTLQMRGGAIAWFAFEALKFKLADKTFYTPDFIVMRNDGYLEAHETKGFWLDDAKVKIKCAAAKFPIKFVGVQFKRGAWVYEEF